MSKSGLTNSPVFQTYLNDHFFRYSSVSTGSSTEPTLVLYDGHRSHVNLTLTEKARRNNDIVFVLPPHASHLTQPLDVFIFAPFTTMCYKECQDFIKRHSGLTVPKYDVAKLTAKPYIKSLTAENLTYLHLRKMGSRPLYMIRRQITMKLPKKMNWTHHAVNQVTMMTKKNQNQADQMFLIHNNLKFQPVLRPNPNQHTSFRWGQLQDQNPSASLSRRFLLKVFIRNVSWIYVKSKHQRHRKRKQNQQNQKLYTTSSSRKSNIS